MSELIEGMGFEREGSSLVFDIAKDAGEGLSIFISDQVRDAGNSGDALSGSNQWILDIAAKTNRAFFSIGRVLTTPPRRNVEPRARLVAIANVPGAVAWQITTRGPMAQRAYVELVSGSGVGALNGLSIVRPRPRDYFRGNARLVTTFDTVLLDSFVNDTSDPATPIPAGGLFVQFFNQATAPVNGDVPIFEQKIFFRKLVSVFVRRGHPAWRCALYVGLGVGALHDSGRADDRGRRANDFGHVGARMMSCRTCIVLPGDRGASDIAQRIAGDGARWRELVQVNPQKRRNAIGAFDYVADGERLALPPSWPDDPFSTFARMPKQSRSAGSRFESSRGGAGALGSVALPNGWVDDDLKAVIVMANDLGISDPRSLTSVWASETGVSPVQQLNPRTKLDLPSSDPWSPFFAGGLNGSTAPVCRALGFKSAADWLGAPIRVQLQGIYKQYVNHVRAMGEGFDARAQRIGTTASALLYAFNFLPAFAVNLRSADQAIVSAGSVYYDQNCVLDTSTTGLVQTRCGQKKGSITLRDFEYLTRANRFPNGWPVYAINARLADMRNDPITISSLGPTGSSVWDAMKSTWEALTGTAEKVDAPKVITNSPKMTGGGIGLSSAEQYWKATGVVIFGAFVVAWTQGWIRR